MKIEDRIKNFRASITPDMFLPDDFIDFESAKSIVERLKSGLNSLQKNRTKKGFSKASLGRAFFEDPNALEALMFLASIRSAAHFPDGRYLPERGKPVTGKNSCEEVASILIDIGADRLISDTEALESQLLIAVVADQAERRRFPTRSRFEEKVSKIVQTSVEEANNQGIQAALVSKPKFPPSAKRSAEYVISIGGRNAVVVSIVFQAQSGGRQQRDLRVTYPNLSKEMEKDGLVLCLIADGQGIKEASDATLTELFKGVPNCMTTNQAEAGFLEEVLSSNLEWVETQRQKSPALSVIIDSALESQSTISVSEVPASRDRAKLALASYLESHPEMALDLTSRGSALGWKRPEDVRQATELRDQFKSQEAVNLLIRLVQAEPHSGSAKDGGVAATPTSRSSLSNDISVFASSQPFSTDLASELSTKSFELYPQIRVAVLILPTELTTSEISNLRRHQMILTVNVIVIDVETLVRMTRENAEPSVILQNLILEQSDLEKVSPFVTRGATPAKMFYGREAEEAVLLGTLVSNSVAILGGRRIGKTSLIKHAETQLLAAGFQTKFCDCQAVRNWSGFGEQVSRVWGIQLSEEFHPHHLLDMVEKLKGKSPERLVILLDEVDQLLSWDLTHSDDEAPEAFFRACRSISQQGFAQFVFSGERTIAKKLWDAESPHWNFCKPLYLTQLQGEETRSLITEPFLQLGIGIEDEDAFSNEVWKRTSGHPELVQFIGDALIKELNKGPRSELNLSASDIDEVTNRFEYAEQYLETYWGQATPLERLASVIISRNSIDVNNLDKKLIKNGLRIDQGEILLSLRMLELYGLIHQPKEKFEIKMEWFAPSLGFYGGPERVIERYVEELLR